MAEAMQERQPHLQQCRPDTVELLDELETDFMMFKSLSA